MKLNEITLETYKKYKKDIESIIDISKSAVNKFLDLGRLFKKINQEETYKLEDYNDIYEFAFDKFGYKSTSVKNFINVFEKYAEEPNNLQYVKLKKEFEDYSFTSLVELLPIDNKEICLDYSPKMTIKEIRETKLVSQLTDDLKERVNKYNYVVDLLQKEVDKLNNFLGKVVVKYVIYDDRKTLDYFRLSSCFSYGWRSFFIQSDYDHFLSLDYKDFSKNFDDAEILNLFDKYLKNAKKVYKDELKDKEERKKQKEIEKEKKKLPYEEKNISSLTYYDSFLFSMLMYLEYVILKSDRYCYDLKVRKYKEKELYEYLVIYNDVEVGIFGYNAENMETYFKFKKKELESNNSLDKKYDLYYWTIDTDDKRCDLFGSNTFDLIKRYYNLVQKEEEEE